ncbi:MAG TPA: peptidoglycan DD-metalloendopeptidase family protein [Aquabacterium sp.]|nr:peptidoglycan DD-metalloendopeptidase family protein [Aquabacterium sp.]
MLKTSLSRLTAGLAILAALAGCASQTHRAPVEDRGRSATSAPPPARVLPGAENAGKPGYYTVKKGDTLIRIGLEAGQSWRDIAVWNNLTNANLIEEGQVLRIVPPVAESTASSSGSAAVSTKPITSPKIEARSLDSKASAPAKSASGSSAASSAASASAASSHESRDTRDSDEPAWIWPANGPTIGTFEEGKRKGLAIGGKAGDPVVAAGDGRVVYAGSGLRGYGNLVIIKHNGDYLTAYAHNQTLLVKEDQVVRKGQKIAEMGATDADRVQLHFEIRKQGKPIDPAKQLPPR